MTMIEILVVATLLVVVFTAVTVVFSGGRKMNKAAELTVAVHAAVRLQEQISLDLKQIGSRPGRQGPIKIGTRSMAFYRVFFVGREMRMRPVLYTLVPTPKGNFHLERQEFSGGTVTDRRTMREAVIRSIEFKELIGAGGEGRFAQVTMEVLNDDLRADELDVQRGGRKFSMVVIASCPVPSLLGALPDSVLNRVIEGDLPETP